MGGARPSGGEAISRRVQEFGTHDRHFHTARGYSLCACVCVSPPLVTVPPIKARHVLHFAAYSGETTLCSVFFLPVLNQPGSHKRVRTLGLLPSFVVFLFYTASLHSLHGSIT